MTALSDDAVARADEIGEQAPDLPDEKRQRLRSIIRRGRRAHVGKVPRDLREDHKEKGASVLPHRTPEAK